MILTPLAAQTTVTWVTTYASCKLLEVHALLLPLLALNVLVVFAWETNVESALAKLGQILTLLGARIMLPITCLWISAVLDWHAPHHQAALLYLTQHARVTLTALQVAA